LAACARQAPKGEAAAIIAGRGRVCVISVVVVAPCDHPFGWEALVNHLGWGFFF